MFDVTFDALARPPARREPSLTAHLALHARLAREHGSRLRCALLAGHAADRLGHAFASGYVEALSRLDPRGRRVPMAFAVTEQGGNHPRALATVAERVADGVRLTGRKSFVTLADHAERIFVVAKEGERDEGTPRLGAYEVPLDAPSLRVEVLPETPFAPEVRHAAIELEGVRVPSEARLPGDGYLDYVKPFRTIEDLHVLAAVVGYRLALSARLSLGADDLGRGLTLAAGLSGLEEASPASPAVHLALARIFDEARGLLPLGEEAMARLAPDERARLLRDAPLLNVADRARRARAERARATLGQS